MGSGFADRGGQWRGRRRAAWLRWALMMGAWGALCALTVPALAQDGQAQDRIFIKVLGDDEEVVNALKATRHRFDSALTAQGITIAADAEADALLASCNEEMDLPPEERRSCELEMARRSRAKLYVLLGLRADGASRTLTFETWDPSAQVQVCSGYEETAAASTPDEAARAGFDALAEKYLCKCHAICQGVSLADAGAPREVRKVFIGLTSQQSGFNDLLDAQRYRFETPLLETGHFTIAADSERSIALQQCTESQNISPEELRECNVEIANEVAADFLITLKLQASGPDLDLVLELRGSNDSAGDLLCQVTQRVDATEPQQGVIHGLQALAQSFLSARSCRQRLGLISTREGMVKVEAAPFTPGCDQQAAQGTCPRDELTAETRIMPSFFIDEAEVTVAAYRACVSAGACSPPRRTHADHEAFNWGASGRDDHPINGVTFEQAVGYCTSQGKRLPDEFQWELAARGKRYQTFPWGERALACAGAESTRCASASTASVQTSGQDLSPTGAHDMAGNVAEWTYSWYGEDLSRPETTGSYRVVRGGHFASTPDTLRRISQRFYHPPGFASTGLGFRCVALD